MVDAKDVEGQNLPRRVRITVVIANHYTFDTKVATGKQIKEKANIPTGFALYRRSHRMHGGNEPIRDNDSVELHDGNHFFARPLSNV